MTYLYFALAGLLVGGVIATRQQKRRIWVSLIFGALAAIFLWAGLAEMRR
ncbi:MAG TPA: hypothetical protein VE287_03220 [Actinopolymorphaceae bacterium]|nr:hypothetical protein [Actinopolymorphaceae bacterium]